MKRFKLTLELVYKAPDTFMNDRGETVTSPKEMAEIDREAIIDLIRGAADSYIVKVREVKKV